MIVKDDPKLNQEVYLEINSKIYHCQRYQIYQQLKPRQRDEQQKKEMAGSGMLDDSMTGGLDFDQDLLNLSEEECKALMQEVDMD